MTSLLLIIALCCGQTDQELAIRLAIAINATQPAPQSVLVEPDHIAEPSKMVPQYTTRQETRYRWVKKCFGGYCRMVRQAYTVNVKVPVASAATKSWPRYPTTPRQQPWTQGGRHITWRHLLEGEHKAWRFDPTWLQSLTQTEIEQLHADCHEGKVRTQFIVTLP